MPEEASETIIKLYNTTVERVKKNLTNNIKQPMIVMQLPNETRDQYMERVRSMNEQNK